jgi:superfamily I DNA/RNA helicase
MDRNFKPGLDYLDAETPDEVTEAKSASHIRLIRGYAGTGKTDVLILRAHHLIRYYPNLDILITTFNRPVFDHRLKPEVKILAPRVEAFLFHEICKDIYKAKYGDYHQPQSTEGVLNRLINDEVEDAATIIDLG